MSFINRLLKHQDKHLAEEDRAPAAPCAHITLVPHWDCAKDMGKQEKIEWYRCESCNSTLSREEGEHLAAEDADRVRLANIERANHR